MFIFGYNAEVDELNPDDHHLVCLVAWLDDDDDLQEVQAAGLATAQMGDWVVYVGDATDTAAGGYFGPWSTQEDACAFGCQHCGVVHYLPMPADEGGLFGDLTTPGYGADDEDEEDEDESDRSETLRP